MSDVNAQVVDALVPAPVPAVEPTPAPVVEPPHHLPGTAPEPAPVDDDAPLDDVVDDDSHHARGRGSRAKSKQAAARINKLAGENFLLNQRLQALEAKQKPSTAANEPVYALPVASRPLPSDPEPTIEQFADKDDPYGAWQRALAKWDRQQEQLQAVSGQQQQQFQQTAQQAEAYWAGVNQTHMQRIAALVAKNPAAVAALQSVTMRIPSLLDNSIKLDNESADIALFLSTHPTVLDEFVLMTAAQPVTEQTVAITRRLLRQRMSAGTTGSVAASPLPNAPRPPNPVRTGATRVADPVPGDGASIADHAKYFMPKR